MRILIDLLHPAHVHFFRNFHTEMVADGHELVVVARDKDVTLDLLHEFAIPHTVISTQRTGRAGLAAEWASRTARLIGIARDLRPDVMTGIMGVSIAPAGRLTRTPSVVFYDTEFATATNRVVYPLAGTVVTPDCYTAPVRGRHLTYPGYHELAYLHPKRFAPSPLVLDEYGIAPDSSYSIVRFVSWEASHDRGEVALTIEQKRSLIDRLASHGDVYLSAESDLPADLEPYRLRGPIGRIHHVLGSASIVVGESATMASEAAVLGTPSVFIATTGRGYIDDLEARYGLARHFTPDRFDAAMAAVSETLSQNRRGFADARERMLADKIDVTAWMVDHFDTYRAAA